DPLGPGWPTAPPACPMLGHQATPSGPLVLISTRRGRYGSRRGAGGEVLEDLQDGAGAHAGGALAHVAQRCGGVAGTGDVQVRPLGLAHELGEEDPRRERTARSVADVAQIRDTAGEVRA